MPWRNGLGFTTELARRDGADGELDWRVSIAEVTADGPFSRFPGCDRVIVVVEGAGMVLAHGEEGVTATVGPLAPHAFAGDVDTHCALRAGPVRDFNLITRRSRWRGEVTVLRPEAAGRVALPAAAALVHCLRGRATVAAGTSEATLAAGETALAEEQSPLELMDVLDAETTLLVVTLAAGR